MVSTYKKLRKLGSGGFGEVWMAERNHDKRKFALKYLLATDSDSIAPFQREVRCLSRLDHPNIVRITSTSLTSAPFWYAMRHMTIASTTNWPASRARTNASTRCSDQSLIPYATHTAKALSTVI